MLRIYTERRQNMPAEAVDVRKSDAKPSFVCVGFPFKGNPHAIGSLLLMTKTRIIKNMVYDPNSHLTWEAVGESAEPGELMEDTVRRGLIEECGMRSDEPIFIYGADGNQFTTFKTLPGTPDLDMARRQDPFCVTEIETHPQPWKACCFAVHMPRHWEQDLSKSDGESGEARWWTLDELLYELKHNPNGFHILHYPAFLRLTEMFANGTFISRYNPL